MRPCVPDRIGIWKCWFLKRRRNQSTRRKTSWSKGEGQQQTQHPHMASRPGFEPEPHSWEQCATLSPPACLSHATRFQAHLEKCKIFTSKKRKDSKGRSINLDLINIVVAFVAINVAVATFLKGYTDA